MTGFYKEQKAQGLSAPGSTLPTQKKEGSQWPQSRGPVAAACSINDQPEGPPQPGTSPFCSSSEARLTWGHKTLVPSAYLFRMWQPQVFPLQSSWP